MKTISHPNALIDDAKAAGIAVPEDIKSYDKKDFPHWHFFVNIQVDRPLLSESSPAHNAKVIASLPEDQLNFLAVEGNLE